MKTFKLCFLIGLLSTFFSCAKDDSLPTNAILGKWNVTQIEYTGTSSTNVQGDITTAEFTGSGVDMKLEIEFTENPNEYKASGDYGINLKTEFLGQSFDYSLSNQGFIDSGTWSQEGDQLTVTTKAGETQTATVTSLTEDVLIITWGTSQTEALEGATVTYDIIGLYTFEKQ
jgi:hypothetical protein